MSASKVAPAPKPAEFAYAGPTPESFFAACSMAVAFHQRNLETAFAFAKSLAPLWPDYVLPQIQRRVPTAVSTDTEEATKLVSAFFGGDGIEEAVRNFYENAIEQGQLNSDVIFGELIGSQPVKDATAILKERSKAAFIEGVSGALTFTRRAFDLAKAP